MKAVALARLVVPGAIAILLSACTKPVEISLGTVGNTMGLQHTNAHRPVGADGPPHAQEPGHGRDDVPQLGPRQAWHAGLVAAEAQKVGEAAGFISARCGRARPHAAGQAGTIGGRDLYGARAGCVPLPLYEPRPRAEHEGRADGDAVSTSRHSSHQRAQRAKRAGVVPAIATYMTPSPYSIGADETLVQAGAAMREHGVRHLPVVYEGRLVGIVTDRDVRFLELLNDVDPRLVTVSDAYGADRLRGHPRGASRRGRAGDGVAQV